MRRISHHEHGAGLVEFSLIALVFIGLIGAIFDIGIGMYRYSILTQAVSATLRDSSTKRPQGTTCTLDTVEEQAETFAMDYMKNTFTGDIATPGYDFLQTEATCSGTLEDGLCPATETLTLRVVGQWDMSCVFCVFWGSHDITAVSQGPLEYNCS